MLSGIDRSRWRIVTMVVVWSGKLPWKEAPRGFNDLAVSQSGRPGDRELLQGCI